MQQANKKLSFSQKHPFIFGFMLILAAVTLISGVMAALRFSSGGKATHGGWLKNDSLGVVYIEGFIADAAKTNDWIRTLRDDDSIKGVLVRINSPGGAVAPSQEMYQAVQRLAAKKPVVVSMGSVAASGGYYIAVAADTIVANPATLTGSIGVKMELANMQGLMEKIGVSHTALTSGNLKNAGSPFQPMTDEEREYLHNLVMDMYQQFIEAVATGRNMPLEEVRKAADGRAITGKSALELGLVDQLGDMETALNVLVEKCGLTETPALVEGPPEEKNLVRDLLTSTISILLTGKAETVSNTLSDTLSGSLLPLRRRQSIQFFYN